METTIKNTTITKNNKSGFERFITKMDTVGIIATIIYYVFTVNTLGADTILLNGQFDYPHFLTALAANTSWVGISLLVFSLFTFIAIIFITISKALAKETGPFKASLTVIWNAIWIIGDAYLLYLILA